MTDAPDVIVSTDGAVGRLTLNRPKAIHALTQGMCKAMAEALLGWRDDPAIRLVFVEHGEGRGFCAGGDIRALWESGSTDGVAARAFFFDEYRLNHLMFTYAKPIVTFMDGITMGGGAGIAEPARYRVATERTTYAMPETGIGLFPDVGAGWYLARQPGRVGAYLAATGARIDGADCLALGIATDYIPAEALPALKAAIVADPDNLVTLLRQAGIEPPTSRIESQRGEIDRLFASDRYEDILAALEADGGDWARTTLAQLHTKSPQAVKVSLRLVAQGRDHSDFAEEMKIEYAVASHVVQRNDFLEGVRALIVDKTNDPKWDPPTAEDVSDHLIDIIFAPLDPADEWTPFSR